MNEANKQLSAQKPSVDEFPVVENSQLDKRVFQRTLSLRKGEEARSPAINGAYTNG